MNLIKVLAESGNTISMSEGRRLVCMEVVKVNGEVATDSCMEVEPDDVIKVGKKPEFTVGSVLMKMDFPLK